MFGLLIEIMFAVLLAVTIGYCALVHRKLEQLRGNQSDLREIVYELTNATGHAEVAIRHLRETVSVAEDRLGARIEGSRELEARLTDAINAGDELVGRLALIGRNAAETFSRNAPGAPQTAQEAADEWRRSKIGFGRLSEARTTGAGA
jgi:hypothetical protein